MVTSKNGKLLIMQIYKKMPSPLAQNMIPSDLHEIFRRGSSTQCNFTFNQYTAPNALVTSSRKYTYIQI